ncbi:hypothetical protein EFK50_01195 [Nocardioides marmoriginsengisoli]|uniref:GxxExxY protein n=1 Tax=Nocardioides marmoriginsengisoli TaxID=661483 RepID=A0A3N0CS09_9ACTN|nr:hypothetical protein [Nocardioides marmoriginsengisoli]RNL66272.1 hypothetical protein EFK50_01195 [Nocardioides marmoriginsengisoli]
MSTTTATLDQVISTLTGYRYAYTDEHALHRGIDAALTVAGIQFVPEVNLSSRDRIDYVAGTVGIEVKVKGSTAALRRQLTRYATHPTIQQLLVVTTLRRHRELPTSISGIPVTVLVVGGGLS